MLLKVLKYKVFSFIPCSLLLLTCHDLLFLTNRFIFLEQICDYRKNEQKVEFPYTLSRHLQFLFLLTSCISVVHMLQLTSQS